MLFVSKTHPAGSATATGRQKRELRGLTEWQHCLRTTARLAALPSTSTNLLSLYDEKQQVTTALFRLFPNKRRFGRSYRLLEWRQISIGSARP